MPRKLPLYVYRDRSRHGRVRFYFRRGKGQRIRLPDDPTSPEFMAKYRQCLTDEPAPPPRKIEAPTESLAWLVQRYKETADYKGLAESTRKVRDNILKHVVRNAGHYPYARITRKEIAKGRDERTAGAAGNFMRTMRGLFKWAHDAGLIAVDPTEGVRRPRQKGDGHAPWTEDDVAKYEARWPEGTKERVWLHVLLYTGLRRGDAVVLGRQHVKNGVATIRTEKKGVEVNIPILPALARTLEIGPTGDLAFICGEQGTPLTKESFGNAFREACKEAGINGKSAHGLRKLGAIRAAESGLTVNELEALFGWTGGRMASHYTKAADRKRLAIAAAEKIRNRLAPHPETGCGENREKG